MEESRTKVAACGFASFVIPPFALSAYNAQSFLAKVGMTVSRGLGVVVGLGVIVGLSVIVGLGVVVACSQ